MLDEMCANNVELNARDIRQFLKQPVSGSSVQTFSGDNGQVQATGYRRENGSGSIGGLLTHYQRS
jgi:hypothetical protein